MKDQNTLHREVWEMLLNKKEDFLKQWDGIRYEQIVIYGSLRNNPEIPTYGCFVRFWNNIINKWGGYTIFYLHIDVDDTTISSSLTIESPGKGNDLDYDPFTINSYNISYINPDIEDAHKIVFDESMSWLEKLSKKDSL